MVRNVEFIKTRERAFFLLNPIVKSSSKLEGMKKYLAIEIRGEIFVMNDNDELGGLIDNDVPFTVIGHVCTEECNIDVIAQKHALEAAEMVKQETKEKCQIAFRNFMLRATLANVSGESLDFEKEFADTMSQI